MFSVKHQKITSRYARALFELALEYKADDAVQKDMLSLHKVCLENKDFASMLQSPVITAAKKSQVLEAIFKNHFHTLSMQFMALIVRKRREMLVDGIAGQYIQMYRSYHGIKTVELTTANPITQTERGSFTGMFSNITGSKVELEENVTPKIIGGFVYSYDNKLYDASIRTRLNALKKEFNLNIYEKGF